MDPRFFPTSPKHGTDQKNVFPFLNRNSHVTFHRFVQDEILEEKQKGLCLALCYEWLGSFYKTRPLKIPFYENTQDKLFIEKLNAMQNNFKLPDVIEASAFKLAISNYAKPYDFSGSSRISPRTPMETPNVASLVRDLIINDAGQIIFFSKKHADGFDGHAIAMACKKDEFGIQVGAFDPNYGEVFFTIFSLLDAPPNARVFWEMNHLSDTRELRYRETFYEFLCRLISRHFTILILHMFHISASAWIKACQKIKDSIRFAKR